MKNILIIDDDVYIGDMLQQTLTKHGYGVQRAYSGTEALLVLQSAVPDLILLDLMLPGLSGEELLPKIRDIPVIVTSAKADADSKISLLRGGAVDYMTKPFDIGELLARIEVQLRKNVPGGTALTFGALSLDHASHCVFFGEKTHQTDPHGVRHSQAADAQSHAGHHQVQPFGADRQRHPRLHGKLAEGAREQSAQKAVRRRLRRVHRVRLGHRIQVEILTYSLPFSLPLS